MTRTETSRPAITFGKGETFEKGHKEWMIFCDGAPAGYVKSQHEQIRRSVKQMVFVSVDVCLWDRPDGAQYEASFGNVDGYDAATALSAAKAWAKAQLSA